MQSSKPNLLQFFSTQEWGNTPLKQEVFIDSRISFKLFSNVLNVWLVYSILSTQADHHFHKPDNGFYRKKQNNSDLFSLYDLEKIFFYVLYTYFENPEISKLSNLRRFFESIDYTHFPAEVKNVFKQTVNFLNSDDNEAAKKKIKRALDLLLRSGFACISSNTITGKVVLVLHDKIDLNNPNYPIQYDKTFTYLSDEQRASWNAALGDVEYGYFEWPLDYKLKQTFKSFQKNLKIDSSTKTTNTNCTYRDNFELPDFADLLMQGHIQRLTLNDVFNLKDINFTDPEQIRDLIEEIDFSKLLS